MRDTRRLPDDGHPSPARRPADPAVRLVIGFIAAGALLLAAATWIIL